MVDFICETFKEFNILCTMEKKYPLKRGGCKKGGIKISPKQKLLSFSACPLNHKLNLLEITKKSSKKISEWTFQYKNTLFRTTLTILIKTNNYFYIFENNLPFYFIVSQKWSFLWLCLEYTTSTVGGFTCA